MTPAWAMGLGSDQLDMYSVNWDVLSAKPEPIYHTALLAYANGPLLGMTNQEIDAAVKLFLEQLGAPLDPHPPLNAFRKLFLIMPWTEAEVERDLDFLMALDDRGKFAHAEYYRLLNGYASARTQLFHALAGPHLKDEQKKRILGQPWTDAQRDAALKALEQPWLQSSGETVDFSKRSNVLVLVVLGLVLWRMFAR